MSDSHNRTFLTGKSDCDIRKELGSNDSVLSTKFTESFSKISDSSAEYSSSGLKRKFEAELDNLRERTKKNNFDSDFCVSPWEYRRLKADLMESQAQRIKLEDRIDELHKKNKEAVIFFDKEKNEMKIQLESNRNTIQNLEYRINKIRKREIECKEELTEKIQILDQTKQKLNERIFKLETENIELSSKLEKYESNSEEVLSKLHEEIKSLKGQNDKLKLQLEEKEELCSSLEKRLEAANENACKFDKCNSELQVALLRIKELEKEKEDFEEARNLTIALSEKALRVPELEKELNEKKEQIIHLKQCITNSVMLEELVHDLKTKLAAAEEREKELPALKTKLMQLEQELENWNSLASDFSTECNRESLRDYIETLQRKELTTSLEINSLNAAVRTSEATLSSLKHELDSLKKHNEKLESALQKLKVEVQVLRRKSVLISRERDSYRQQLDLYEKDLTMTGLSSESISNEIVSQLKTRVKNLESLLSDYRKHMETLEAQLKEYQGEDCTDTIETICKLKHEIKMLEEENNRLLKVKDELELKLENKALKGEYLKPNVKILHFRDNPAAEAERKQEKDLNSLREECDRLRARVKLLESGEVLNITQKVSEDVRNCNSQKISELEKELQSANLKMQRLKEVFKKTSQEFRDVSYMLLGYRIDLASNNKLYKLYNMYSSSPSDYLMFQHSKTGDMEMLGTPFAESLSKLVDEYLHKGNSIPAFLSAVTLELCRSSQSDEESEDKEDDIQEDTDSMEPIQLD